MGTYSDNPIIEGRYDAYGRQTYWGEGYKGEGVKVAVIDDFSAEHGHQMASIGQYIAPECEIVKLDMRGSGQGIRDMLYEAVKLKCNIVSLSRYVEADTKDMHDAVIACKNAGILMFCSAGNQGEKYPDNFNIVQYPAAYEETVSVLSVDNSMSPSKFSSHGITGTVTGFGQNVLVKNTAGLEMLVSGTSPTTAAIAFTMALYLCKLFAEGKKPTFEELMDAVKTNMVDYGIVGHDNMTGFGFFTLDKAEHERVRMMILDADGDGLSDRVKRIKDAVSAGTSYEDASITINKDYFVVGYEMLNGVLVPVYGGRRTM